MLVLFYEPNAEQLLATDILVPATMKNAANCDTYCELQNSVNHQIFERTRRSRVSLGARSSQCRLAPKLGCVSAGK